MEIGLGLENLGWVLVVCMRRSIWGSIYRARTSFSLFVQEPKSDRKREILKHRWLLGAIMAGGLRVCPGWLHVKVGLVPDAHGESGPSVDRWGELGDLREPQSHRKSTVAPWGRGLWAPCQILF